MSDLVHRVVTVSGVRSKYQIDRCGFYIKERVQKSSILLFLFQNDVTTIQEVFWLKKLIEKKKEIFVQFLFKFLRFER